MGTLKDPQSKEEALEQARDILNRTDKRNAEIYKVPIAKPLSIEVGEISGTVSGYWIFTFERTLPSHRMYFRWILKSIEE